MSKMKVQELKIYLRKRGLNVSGRKEELVARVFAASENNVQPIKTAQEVEMEVQNENRNKLILEDYVVPDPFHLENCLSEEEDISFWPIILYPDIFNFIALNPAELGGEDLRNYRSSKAYSYFSDGWLGQISYHEIHNSCKYCLLETDCRPSERLNDPPHKLWVCAEKKTGKIQCAHCTCMAGLSQACNHVTACLFRVETAIRAGLTNPSCTSKSNEWLPDRIKVQPMKLKDINFERSDFGKRGGKSRLLFLHQKRNTIP